MMPLPSIDPLEEYRVSLVQMVARTSWLPDPDTVRKCDRAILPTVRARKGHIRGAEVIVDGKSIGMYDDNTTPRWAMLWAHGIPITHHPSGRTFAHVWEGADDISAYTLLANMVLVPEPFAALTDKSGPLTHYLRWHAWSVYGWKPSHAEVPTMPEDFADFKWRYLPGIEDPSGFIRQRLATLNNGRTRVLRLIMTEMGML